MANAFHAGLTPIAIAREALMILENNLVWANLVFRDHTTEFTGKRRGDTVYIRGPANFTVDEFDGSLEVQNITETNIGIVLEKHFDISVEVTAKERTLDLEDYSSQVLVPQMSAMAQAIDAYVSTKTIELNQYVGTAGTPPNEWADVTLINKRAQEAMIPFAGRNAVVNPECEAELWEMSQFHAANVRGDGGTALEQAKMGRVLGIDWYMNQNIVAHTAGLLKSGGGTTVNGAHSTLGVTTVAVTGGDTAGTGKKGDLVHFGDGYQYVLTADVTLSAGAGNLSILPGLKAALSGGETVVQVADHDRNALFHRNAFALCVVPLELPAGAANAQYVQSRGMGLRLVSGYDMDAKKDVISLDVLVGAKCIDPRLGVRILS